MKKLLFILLVFHFSLITLKAQVDTGKKVAGFVTLGYGLCQPVSSFGSTANNPSSGYAQTGTANNLSFGIMINSINFGFAFMRSTSNNNYNVDAYTNNLQANLPSSSYKATSGKQPYLGGYIFYGIYKAFYISRFTFDARVMLGPCSVILPITTYGEIYNGLQSSYYINAGTISATAYSVGLAVRYSITKGFCASLDVTYIYTQLNYSTTENYADNNGNTQTYPITGSLPVSLLNVSLNLGWQFGRNLK
jgi:hypothetical protein